MSSPGHEDHSDLDSLFGDDESHDEYSSEAPKCQQRSVIQLPRAAVVSQNVGTIAHSSVPSSTEHPSSGHMSSASIPLISDTVTGPLNRSKRNASPGPGQPTKKRRVDSEAAKPSDKPSLGNLGVSIAPGQSLTSTKLQSVASLLAPSTAPSRGISRGSKGKSTVTHNVATRAPVVSGTGTAVDPVIIPDESSTLLTPSQSATPAPQTANRRANRSQQARLLLEALPNDPSDLLSQTLRTILKTPTTAPCGRSSVPRDTAVYLANGRLTGTPFLRLLRHLAGPTRQTEPAVGLALLKKLVEAMRATEEMISKTASAGQSSAASTPMPTTPGTPSTASFPSHDTPGVPPSSKQILEPNLFSQFGFPAIVGLDTFPLPPIAEFDPTAQTDIAIDPELLALSQDPVYPQTNPQNHPDLEFDLAELFGALPTSALDWSASPTLVPGTEPIPVDTTASWDSLTNLPLDDLLKGWPSAGQPPSCESQLSVTINTTTQAFNQPIPSVFSQPPNTANPVPGARRIPAKAEAQALLERARDRKKELETKIAAAKRQLWGCKIEAGVERNLLDKLKK